MKNALTVDVEEWFQVSNLEGAVPRESWPSMPSRVEASTRELLDLFDERKARGTFFVLGWVAQRHPDLVREIVARGHEVASHGFAHELVYRLTPESFARDLDRAREAIENASGVIPRGYRAPSFSIVPRSFWALDVLARPQRRGGGRGVPADLPTLRDAERISRNERARRAGRALRSSLGNRRGAAARARRGDREDHALREPRRHEAQAAPHARGIRVRADGTLLEGLSRNRLAPSSGGFMNRKRLASLVTPAIILGAWIVIYARLIPELVFDWASEGDFSHGFLVPLAVLALIAVRVRRLRRIPPSPGFAGAFVLACAIVILLIGSAASELYLQRSSMIPFLWGWVWLLEGPSRARLLSFPIVFLMFMIPPPGIVWSAISLPLQLLASQAAEASLHLAGIPVLREGNVIHLEHHSLEVASACSGIRSLIALLALAALLADGTFSGDGAPRTLYAKGLLVLLAVPVAVLVNALRVSSAAFVATAAGRETVDRFHEISGFATFILAFALLAAGKGVLRWIEERPLWRSASS
jgi:exosortase